MTALDNVRVFVSFPDAKYTEKLVHQAIHHLSPNIRIHSHLVDCLGAQHVLQWSTYDEISHEATMARPQDVLSSSYVIRKSLIRKHFLHRSVKTYLAKNPTSRLGTSVPQTWNVEIVHADELDELWMDDLYDLAQLLPDESNDAEEDKWFILKPGMADRGMGIRLFKSKAGLQAIFDAFNSDEEDSEGEESDTNVVTSQLRHFVIQEYLPNPLLIDPRESMGKVSALEGRKFHLRAYCVSQGALKVFLFPRILALFSSAAYQPPSDKEEGSSQLSAHLTNTALQESRGEENVRLLQELVGSHIFGREQNHGRSFTQADVDWIIDEVANCLGEVFKAGLTSAIHFQTLPNAFELFGADFLVTYSPEGEGGIPFQVHLLEINAEPAIHLTGPRLGWILEELFREIADTCVGPFFTHTPREETGDAPGRLRQCLEIQVRGTTAW